MSAEGAELDFEYDHNGMRIQKVLHHDWYPETTKYTYHGKLLTHLTVDYTDWDEVVQQDKLHFFYDVQSRPTKISYNGDIYTYVHNYQGDIVGLLNNSGTLVVEYKYDAWGKLLSATGTLSNTLGKRNPFRYRGYIYDEESELYYLRSRYYSPILQRFISADISILPDKDLRNNNMYAYCRNAPVTGVDSHGTSWWNSCAKWFSDNIIDPIVDGATKLVNSIDMTFTIGYSASITVGCWTYSTSWGLSVDTKGGIGFQVSTGASLGIGETLDVNSSFFVTVTNAPTISALKGDSTQVGMSIDGGLVQGSCDQVFFDTTSGTYTGYAIAVGLSAPPLIPMSVVSVHVTQSYTDTIYPKEEKKMSTRSTVRSTNSSYSYIRRGCMGPILQATMRARRCSV